MVQRRGVEAGEELTWDYGNEYPYPVPLRRRRLYRIPASSVRHPGTHTMPQRSVVPALNNTPAARSTRASDRAQRSRSVVTGICPSFEKCKSPIAKTTRLPQPVFTTRLRAPALAQCMLGQVCTPRVGPVGRGEGWIPCPPCPYMPLPLHATDCELLRTSNMWAGDVAITATARAYGVGITIIQGEKGQGPSRLFGSCAHSPSEPLSHPPYPP